MTRLMVVVGIVLGSGLVSRSLAAEPVPAEVLDLSLWKLTLPVRSPDGKGAAEVPARDLSSFRHPDCFFVNERADGVVFRAHCGGATTKGSRYPRCELREMADQTTRAAWSTTGKSRHTMTMRVAITGTPPVKPHVVCAQIHDADDDLMMVRLEGKKLLIERNSVGDMVLDSQYKLGTPVDLTIEAGEGRVKVWYEGDLKMNWEVAKDGCYFKAGCYTQSNLPRGDAADSFGEVVIYRLQVTHGKGGD